MFAGFKGLLFQLCSQYCFRLIFILVFKSSKPPPLSSNSIVILAHSFIWKLPEGKWVVCRSPVDPGPKGQCPHCSSDAGKSSFATNKLYVVRLFVSQLLLQIKSCFSPGESVYVTAYLNSGKSSGLASCWLSFLIRRTFIYHVCHFL